MSFNLTLMIIVGIFTASLGLNLSSVAMMSGHALSQKTALRRLCQLLRGFLIGVVIANLLLLSTVILFIAKSPFVLNTGIGFVAHHRLWSLAIVGLTIQALVMLFCKILKTAVVNPWVPEIVRTYLRKRCTKTTSIVEAISLGIISVLANFWLLLLPFSLLAISLLSRLEIKHVVLFALVSGLPTLMIALAVKQQVKISQIQLFLIKQANFLHFVAFFSLIILGMIIACFKLAGDF